MADYRDPKHERRKAIWDVAHELGATHGAFGDVGVTMSAFDAHAPRLGRLGVSAEGLAMLRSQIARQPQQALAALKSALQPTASTDAAPIAKPSPQTTATGIEPFVVGRDDTHIKNIDPADWYNINRHAIAGGGSPREADFTKVNLGDLPDRIRKYAAMSGSPLNAAVNKALATGQAQPIRMRQLSAGGGEGGKTGWPQMGGIGRFTVATDGVVIPGRDGAWTFRTKVVGEKDDQDYPHDPKRGKIAGFVNDRFGELQKVFTGVSYPITFFGSQDMTVSGEKK